ncbi:hypothetical protein F5887DRAFT_895306 [Amanita rubescens]|nr:hypothetical protein F5887DRAFT_896986 [Amanita rubescens]KAF8330973.1 hypothetical protein F5887DRAFT_895306 [Amanita rubescens]
MCVTLFNRCSYYFDDRKLRTNFSVELWFKIFDLLPIEDILVLERTSQRLRDLKDEYCQSVFKLTRVLMPFLSSENDVQEFVKTMKGTDALISGSTALQFFDRTYYQYADLDLYFEAKHLEVWKTQMIAFGYTLVPKIGNNALDVVENIYEYPSFQQIEALETFKHRSTAKVVQLMATKASPIRAILDFHSTCVMNVITHARAYSLYPVSTFIQRETIVCGPINKKALKALDKYKKRGWLAVHTILTENFQCAADELKMRTRWLGDSRCWMINLEGENKEWSKLEGHNILWCIKLTKYAKTYQFNPQMVIKN